MDGVDAVDEVGQAPAGGAGPQKGASPTVRCLVCGRAMRADVKVPVCQATKACLREYGRRRNAARRIVEPEDGKAGSGPRGPHPSWSWSRRLHEAPRTVLEIPASVLAQYGAVGSEIDGSRYVRDYCARCRTPIRVLAVELHNVCERCGVA